MKLVSNGGGGGVLLWMVVCLSETSAYAFTTRTTLSSRSRTTRNNNSDNHRNNQRMTLFVSNVQEDDTSRECRSLTDNLFGTVDESRVAHPELYDNNEVPRLFSNLQYTAAERTTTTHHAGNWLSAAALVAGTTIGAGILALPATTMSAGMIPSSLALCLGYIYMTMSGLYIAELTLNRLGNTGKTNIGILNLYESSLGPVGGKVGSIAYFFLHYAVLIAYIAQGGVNLGVPGVAFATVVASSIFVLPKKVLETINNWLVVGVFGTFFGILGLGAQTADIPSLFLPELQHFDRVVDCFPVIFLAFVYQNIVPVIVKTLEGDRSKITKAIVTGTTLPLIMFLLWNSVVLGNLSSSSEAASIVASGATIDPVALLQANGPGVLGPLVGGFSTLALITSMIGFTYGLLDAWKDVLQISESDASNDWKLPLFALVFVPPTLFATFNPDSFLGALEYGGAFGVSTLFLVLPPLMVWKERYQADTPIHTKPMVPFGKLPLGSMWKAAGTLILEQGAEKLGVFDAIHTVLSS